MMLLFFNHFTTHFVVFISFIYGILAYLTFGFNPLDDNDLLSELAISAKIKVFEKNK